MYVTVWEKERREWRIANPEQMNQGKIEKWSRVSFNHYQLTD